MVSIYREFNYLENIIKKSIVVIGNFDGVHLGHKAVLNYAKSLKNNKSTSSRVCSQKYFIL